MTRKIRINFSDFWHPNNDRAVRENPIYQMLSKYFDLELCANPDFLIFSSFGRQHLKHNCVRIFYTGENVRPDFDICDYAFSFDYPVTERNYRLPLYRLYAHYDLIWEKGRNLRALDSLGFCSFLYSNRKAKERIEFFHNLSRYRKVDSGGKVLNNLGRPVSDKLSFLRDYKFTIAFENSCYPGYTTEKLLDGFVANTVPIYWGNPLVAKDFNSEAFINCHDFANFDEVVDRVKEIDRDPGLYIKMLSAPAFEGSIENPFVKESNIIQRFETIFSTEGSSRSFSSYGKLRYLVGGGDLKRSARELAKNVLRNFR